MDTSGTLIDTSIRTDLPQWSLVQLDESSVETLFTFVSI